MWLCLKLVKFVPQLSSNLHLSGSHAPLILGDCSLPQGLGVRVVVEWVEPQKG